MGSGQCPDLAELAAAAGVDGGDAELVGGAVLQRRGGQRAQLRQAVQRQVGQLHVRVRYVVLHLQYR